MPRKVSFLSKDSELNTLIGNLLLIPFRRPLLISVSLETTPSENLAEMFSRLTDCVFLLERKVFEASFWKSHIKWH